MKSVLMLGRDLVEKGMGQRSSGRESEMRSEDGRGGWESRMDVEGRMEMEDR